jgi:hypothetical protein
MFNQAVLASNPDVIQINDFKIGFINADVVKDMCPNLLLKGTDSAKIDLSLQSMLEQRAFYPIYPGHQETPIEYSQFEHMMIGEQAPDILITPTDLTQFVKVSFSLN